MNGEKKRRHLDFQSLDEVVAEAERLVQGKVHTTGQYTFGQILEHLARTHDMASGKTEPPHFPWFMRMLMPLMRKSILNSDVKPGFKLPKKAQDYFWPEGDVDVSDALAHLKASVQHYNENGPLSVHPLFGKATREQIDRLNCSHCAMHLSFVHPE